MAILQDILNWSKDLPNWQSDAIRRLFGKQTLLESDVDDIAALLKSEKGITDPKGRIAERLSSDKVAVPGGAGKKVELSAIKNLRFVNAIAENQTLGFSNSGLTIVYGDNGTGKSGYSRVLKKACRSRDHDEAILPNARLEPAHNGPAEAIFEVKIDGVVTELPWKNDGSAPADLSAISIFDRRCARAYLDEEDDFAYVPYGFDVLENLGILAKNLKTRLEGEANACVVDLTQFQDLLGPTQVGALVGTLSKDTNPIQIEKLATLTTDETKKKAELEASLIQANPADAAKELRLKAGRLSALENKLREKANLLSADEISKLRKLKEDNKAAQLATELAAKKFNETEILLEGTGGPVWKKLFEAARAFSGEAYPGKMFPVTAKDSKCVLCQQELLKGGERLQRFEEFVQQQAAKAAVKSEQDFMAEQNRVKIVDIGLGLAPTLLAEIKSLDENLLQEIINFEQQLTDRLKKILGALVDEKWGEIQVQPMPPVDKLTATVVKLSAEAEALENVSDEQIRNAMKKELLELDIRQKLASKKDIVLKAVGNMVKAYKLNECVKAVKTTAISNMARDLAEKIVSKELADALNQEFSSLGVGELQVTLKTRADKAKALHKLVLNLPQGKSLESLLSEGEQTAIAIGSFLAEVNLSGLQGGIVFDDPVSSLDHRRRNRVARRLVEEAKKRQVIIFSHDIYFVSLLLNEASEQSVICQTQSLARRSIGFGVPDGDLPFEGKNTGGRLGELNAILQNVTKLHKEGNESEYKKQCSEAYRKMRDTWERAIEEVLLNGVVTRFKKPIETQKMKSVTILNEDYDSIDQGMGKCSNYCHDRALIDGAAMPFPDELAKDITDLSNWVDEVRKRQGLLVKQRKAGA